MNIFKSTWPRLKNGNRYVRELLSKVSPWLAHRPVWTNPRRANQSAMLHPPQGLRHACARASAGVAPQPSAQSAGPPPPPPPLSSHSRITFSSAKAQHGGAGAPLEAPVSLSRPSDARGSRAPTSRRAAGAGHPTPSPASSGARLRVRAHGRVPARHTPTAWGPVAVPERRGGSGAELDEAPL